MYAYFISFDFKKEDWNYGLFYNELISFGGLRVFDKLWCFNAKGTNPQELKDHFVKFIHTGDSLIVFEISNWNSFNDFEDADIEEYS